MTKWEQVFTETLASLVSGQSDKLYRQWLDQTLEVRARSLCHIAATIADEATKHIKLLQPLESKHERV